MKFLVVLVLLLSGLGWGFARTKSSAQDAHSRKLGGDHGALSRATVSRSAQSRPSLKTSSTSEAPGRTAAGLPDPVLLMLFGGLMFLMSWICVAWASWRERQSVPGWEGAEGEILAEAG